VFDLSQFRVWFGWMRQIFSEQSAHLNQLDAAIGDGDHGYTISRAFTSAELAVQPAFLDLGQAFDAAAQALAETSGGAIGPILAAFFAEGGITMRGLMEANTRDVANFFDNGMNAVMQIGGTQPGDKTMLDALAPAVKMFSEKIQLPLPQAVTAARLAALQGAESTREMLAAQGRARFLGERSRGHQDAGATSFVYMLESLERACNLEEPIIVDKTQAVSFTPAPGKFTNHPDKMIDQDNEGLALAFPRLVTFTADRILVRSEQKSAGKVGLAIGHGGGHTPSMGGFVGHGLLDTDVYGPVFTCASGVRIARAIELADQGEGVVLLVSNHSGDVLNARLAVRRAEQIGVNVRMVFSSDDIATAPRSDYLNRRGLGGLLFPLKIGGAAAEAGLGLDEIASLMEKANQRTATLAVAARSPTHPVTGELLFNLPHGEVEIGTGVHGEVGVYRGQHLPADAIITMVLERLLDDLSSLMNNRVAVFLNGSGGTSKMELHILYGGLCRALQAHGIHLHSGVVDSLFTTQEMAGFSLSVLALDDELTNWWSKPADGPYFHWPR